MKIFVKIKSAILFLSIGVLSFGQSKVGNKIEGNFSENGRKITATAIKTKEGHGNPVEGGTPDTYEIRFSDRNLKPIKPGCCEIILINEGDLNKDGKDDISIYQAPMNGCTYSMTTYSHTKGNWKKIIDNFMIPTGCEEIDNNELQKIIFRENNNIYYLKKDMTDENGKIIKEKIKLK